MSLAKKKDMRFYQNLINYIDKYGMHKYLFDSFIYYYITLDKKVFLKALDEGYVILSIIKLLLVGPPAVGKTSFKHLLFD